MGAFPTNESAFCISAFPSPVPHLRSLLFSRRSHRLTTASVLALACVAPSVFAQTPAQILARPDVQAMMASIKTNEPHFIDEQVRISEIPSSPFKEDVRGAELARLFKAAGLVNVRTDKAGNVLGDRPGAQPKPHLVVAAHLDTVFPPGTDFHVKRTGNVLAGPGIGDDTRGLACLLAVIHAMQEAKVKTTGTVTFIANVGEEGQGDLRGMKELFGNTLKGDIDDFISIEPGEPNRVSHKAIGSYRYRVTVTGPGGHSYGAFGLANPIQAIGRMAAHIDDIQVPTDPKTTFNIGTVTGGTSVNSIPFSASFEYDERSPDKAALDATDVQFKAAVQKGLDEENARWHDKGKLAVKIDTIGIRPGGEAPLDSNIVKTAAASVTALGFGTPIFGDGSSDSNIPWSMGIPAVTLGGGGAAKGAHSLGESIDTTDSWKGPQNALLTILSIVK
jgi:acetylornithine deacetylase/succinyl-diaminopimelate desuccinylase-like protein